MNLSDKDVPVYGSLMLSDAFHDGLEPAPITPTDSEVYQLFSGTIKATYNAQRSLRGDNIVIAPSIMSGNTGKLYSIQRATEYWRTAVADTRYYWDLTKHIFRYNHHNQGNSSDALAGVHTVNERKCSHYVFGHASANGYILDIVVDSFLEIILFFTTLILNADESTILA